jgi:hypothetical protein
MPVQLRRAAAALDAGDAFARVCASFSALSFWLLLYSHRRHAPIADRLGEQLTQFERAVARGDQPHYRGSVNLFRTRSR